MNLAYNTVAGSIGATLSEISWLSTAYILGAVAVLPLSGWLAARFGRRNCFLFGIGIFGIASVLCGLSTNVLELALFRALQGIAAGNLSAIGMAALYDVYPKDEMPKAMTYFTVATASGTAFGPALGGFLISVASWPFIFFIQTPIVVLAFLLAYTHAEDQQERPKAAPVAWIPLITMLLGVVSLQYALQVGQEKDWLDDQGVVLALLLSAVCIPAFVLMQWRAAKPMVNLRLLRNPGFSQAIVIVAVVNLCIGGINFIAPLFLQQDVGLPPFQAALVSLPANLALLPVLFFSPRLMKIVPGFWLILISLASVAGGAVCMAWLGARAEGFNLIWPRTIQIVGGALWLVPLQTMIITAVPREQSDTAMGMTGLARQLGGSIGVAIFGTMLEFSQNRLLEGSLSRINRFSWAYSSDVKRAAAHLLGTSAQRLNGAEALMIQAVSAKATDAAFAFVFLASAGVLGAAIFVLAIARLSSAARQE